MTSIILATALYAQLYNGLLYAEMGTIAAAMKARGQAVSVLWHDQEPSVKTCPPYLIGHSMGAQAAIRQATRCKAQGHAPKAVLLIDPARTAPASCAVGLKCINWYNPSHPIGGQFISGATNIRVLGTTHVYMPLNATIMRGVLAASR